MSEFQKRPATAEDFLNQLLESYEPDAPNDDENLRQLASLYAFRRRWTDQIDELTTKETITKADQASADKALENLRKLNESIGKLETLLQIDRANREAAEGAREAQEVIREYVSQGVDFAAKELVFHMTDHAASGVTYWAFRDERYTPYCAKCHSKQLAFRSPYNDKEYPFRVVTQEQLDEYVRANDFVPKGAPRNIGVFDKPNLMGEIEERLRGDNGSS